jgi:hypothetical protein
MPPHGSIPSASDKAHPHQIPGNHPFQQKPPGAVKSKELTAVKPDITKTALRQTISQGKSDDLRSLIKKKAMQLTQAG